MIDEEHDGLESSVVTGKTVTIIVEREDGTTSRLALAGPTLTVELKRDEIIDWPASRRVGWIVRRPGPVVAARIVGEPVGDA